MKKITIMVSLVYTSLATNAQTKQQYTIYDTLAKMYNYKPISPVTSVLTLKSFDFKNYREYDFNPKDTLNRDWKLFFNNVDVQKVEPGKLDSNFLEKYAKTKNSQGGIRFSPIIISCDGTKAICGVHSFGVGETLFLFEKTKTGWIYRRNYFISVE